MAEVPRPPEAAPALPPPASADNIDSLPLPPHQEGPSTERGEGVLPPPPPPGAMDTDSGLRPPESEPATEDEETTPLPPPAPSDLSPEERLRQAELHAARADGAMTALQQAMERQARITEALAASRSTSGSTTDTADAMMERQQALAERNEVKGKKQWDEENPFNESNWPVINKAYRRDKQDIRRNDFSEQLANETAALVEVATDLIAQPNVVPSLDPLIDIPKTASGTDTISIAVTTPSSGAEFGPTDARMIAIDLVDALAQRAGEAYTLHMLGKLDEHTAQEIWNHCAAATGNISERVLYPIGNEARERFNSKNEHLEDREKDPTINENVYRDRAIGFMRTKFFTLARGDYTRKAVKLTQAYELAHPSVNDAHYTKSVEEEEDVKERPQDVAKLFKAEPLSQDPESRKYKWGMGDKVGHWAVTAVCGAGSLIAVTGAPKSIDGNLYWAGGMAASYGLGKGFQAWKTHKRMGLATTRLDRLHKVDSLAIADQTDAPTIKDSAESFSERAQPKYPEPIKPPSTIEERRRYMPTVRLRAAKAIVSLTTAAALAGVGAFNPDVEAGAVRGEMEEVDGFRNSDSVAPEELESDNPGFYDTDTQLNTQEEEEVQRLMEEEGMTFQEALEALDNGN